jgi:DNA-binding transcriptional MerR regulator
MQLNCRQIAALCGVTHVTVSAWVKRGYLVPSATKRNAKLFDVEHVRNALMIHKLKVAVGAFDKLTELSESK